VIKRTVTSCYGWVIALAQDVALIRAELSLMKWMHGITIGGMLALLV
jgi:hypothetical protein